MESKNKPFPRRDLLRRALKLAEYNKQPIGEYFNGWASIQTSEWFVHELAHAGKEIKDLWDFSKKQFKIDPESVHPQIFGFQNKYTDPYKKAVTRGRGANALIVGIEAIGNLNMLRTKLYAEAETRGIKFE